MVIFLDLRRAETKERHFDKALVRPLGYEGSRVKTDGGVCGPVAVSAT
jgi:hypothetical protein